VAAKLDAVKGYLHHLNLPLPPEQIKLESISRRCCPGLPKPFPMRFRPYQL
jgi:hypothetical protein